MRQAGQGRAHLEKQPRWRGVKRAGPAEANPLPPLPTLPRAQGEPGPKEGLCPRLLYPDSPAQTTLVPSLSHLLPSLPSARCSLPTAFLNLPHSLLPGPGPSCLCFPLHGGGSQPSASSPLRGLPTPACSLASPWQGETALGSFHPLAWLPQEGRHGAGWGGGLSPPRLSGSQEPGVGCSSEQCNSVGPAQEGGGGRPECWGTYLCPRLGHPAPRGVPLGTWVLWVPCRLL